MRGGANKSFGIEVAQLAGVDGAVTERAKKILKTLEKKDVAKAREFADNEDGGKSTRTLSEAERIIRDLDINNLSPMQAFNVLADLSEKVRKDKI